MTVTDYQVNRIGRALSGAARVAWHGRDAIRQHPVLRELADQTSGLLDCVDGMLLTSPQERAALHLRRIGELTAQLPLIDGEADR